MARQPREISETGLYHVMLRGVNRQEIFHDNEDRVRLLETFARFRTEHQMQILAWCLMGNHMHWVLKEGTEELAKTMKRIEVSYAWYCHHKYQHVGHLFQNRYRSECVETDEYLLAVIRYVHQNPVHAGLVAKSEDWEWSSMRGYLGRPECPAGLTDRDWVLNLFSEDEGKALVQFREFHQKDSEDKCLDDFVPKHLTDDEARQEIQRLLQGRMPWEVKNLPRVERDEILQRIRSIEGVTQRQTARILGISPNIVFKV